MGKIIFQSKLFLPKELDQQSFIYANVRFGTPSRNCSGVGICRVDLLDAAVKLVHERVVCHTSLVILAPADLGEGQLVALYFYLPSMRMCSVKQLFINGGLILPEQVKLPCSEALGIGKQQYLAEGSYPVVQQGVWLKTEVRLKGFSFSRNPNLIKRKDSSAIKAS